MSIDTVPTSGKIKVMQAFEDGIIIESRRLSDCFFREDRNPTWDWFHRVFRIIERPSKLVAGKIL